EPLFALETDKVSTDVVAEKSGVLETKVPEGQEVKIGEVIAIIDDSKQRLEKEKKQIPKEKQPEAKKKEREPQKTPKAVAPSFDGGAPTRPDTSLSPAVRRIIEEEKIQLEEIAGTGPGGRLTKADALTAVGARGKTETAKSVGEADSSPRVQAKAEGRFTRQKM